MKIKQKAMKKIVFILAAILMSLIAFGQEKKIAEFSNPNGQANISWTETTVDLGELEHNVVSVAEFELKNTGTIPLIITKVVASCGCTATDYPKQPIPPGTTAVIKATYDSKTKGAFSKTVTVFTNAPEGRSVLTLKGKVS